MLSTILKTIKLFTNRFTKNILSILLLIIIIVGISIPIKIFVDNNTSKNNKNNLVKKSINKHTIDAMEKLKNIITILLKNKIKHNHHNIDKKKIIGQKNNNSLESEEIYNHISKTIKSAYINGINLILTTINRFNGYIAPDPTLRERITISSIGLNSNNKEFKYLGLKFMLYDKDKTTNNSTLLVSSILNGSELKNAGIQKKDIIVSINNQSFNNLKDWTDCILEYDNDKYMTIKYRSIKDQHKTIRTTQAKKAKIKIENLYSKIIKKRNKQIGILQFNLFYRGLSIEIANELKRFQKAEVDGIIIDLRNNSGGLLDETQKIASLMLPNNSKILITKKFELKDKAYSIYTMKSYGKPIINIKTPIVILTNGFTASASEILSGALQDNKRATIIGMKTFGKGSAQAVIYSKIFKNGIYKITHALTFTPNQNSISDGIQPHITIDNNKYFNKLIKQLEQKSKLYNLDYIYPQVKINEIRDIANKEFILKYNTNFIESPNKISEFIQYIKTKKLYNLSDELLRILYITLEKSFINQLDYTLNNPYDKQLKYSINYILDL